MSHSSGRPDPEVVAEPVAKPAKEKRPKPAEKDMSEKRLLSIAATVTKLETQVGALVRSSLIDPSLVAPELRLAAQRFGIQSQFGEDGIVLALHAAIGADTRRFVEIGSGPNGGNSGVLAAELGWSGLMIDASESEVAAARELNPATITAAARFVTAENVNDILREHGFEGPIDQLGIDIDGNDLWIWAALDAVRPRVVVVEYNSSFGPRHSVTVPYDPEFTRPRERGVRGLYYGASLTAFCDLAASRGYRLVAVEPTGVNAFFVRDDLAPAIPTLSPQEAYRSLGKHRHVMAQGDVVTALEADGLPLTTPATSGPPDQHKRAAVLDRVATFERIAKDTPLAGVDTPDGRFIFSTSDETVGQLLFAKRSRIEFVVLRRALAALGREGRDSRRVILDVGANIGTTTVSALATHGFERAVAFEPEPGNARLLVANAALNDVTDRLVVRRAAASDVAGVIELALDPSNSGGHEVPRGDGAADATGAPGERLEVPAVCIDDELDALGVDPATVDLLWIDVQGHEPQALRGAARVLAGGAPVVAEVAPGMLEEAGAQDELIQALLPTHGRYLDLRGPKGVGMQPIEQLWSAEGLGAQDRKRAFTDVLFLP